MKYLIDPNYVLSFPFNMIPDTLADLTNFQVLRKLKLDCRLNKKAFSKFDGIDLNFTLSSLFEGKENRPRWDKIKKIKKKDWKIYAFHGGHENLRSQFKYMEFNLAENTSLVKKKIDAQLRVAKYLSSAEKPIIIYHSGQVDKKTKDLSNVIKNLEFAVQKAENLDLIIAIENLSQCTNGYYIGSDYKDLKEILKNIKSPNLGVCFDWGHANNYSSIFAKENKKSKEYIKTFAYQREMIEELNTKIVYAHMHYNTSHLKTNLEEAGDEHLSLTLIPAEEIKLYKQTVKDLMQKTSIKNYDCILLELMPKKVFGFYTFWPTGMTRKEQYKSLDLFKSMAGDKS